MEAAQDRLLAPDAEESWLRPRPPQQFANFPGHLSFPQPTSACCLPPPVTVTPVSRSVNLQSDHATGLSSICNIRVKGKSKSSLYLQSHTVSSNLNFFPENPKSMFFKHVFNDHLFKRRTNTYKRVPHSANTTLQPPRSRSLVCLINVQC